jgi:regulator of sigma D
MTGETVEQTERRASADHLMESLVTERTEMLVLFCRVAGLEPFSEERNRKNAASALQQFCQVMVDYIAAGHFSLYERIVNGTERRKKIADLAEKLYPRISKTTEIALDFNDKYDCEESEISEDLGNDLSRLGEELAIRVELEDQLLSAMQR